MGQPSQVGGFTLALHKVQLNSGEIISCILATVRIASL